MIENECPNCGEEWGGYECYTCGYAKELLSNEYETPEGNIVRCSEEEAYDAGYISICPICAYNVITWWEKEDHGKCIECWDSDNRK